MPSIAEATRTRRDRERRRLATGLGLLVIGALLVGLGAAGSVEGTTAKTSFVIGGLAVVASLAVFAARAPLAERERALVSVGTAVSVASLLFVWALAPAAVLSRPALTAAGTLGFVSGVVVLLAAVLAGVTVDRSGRRERSGVAWTRSSDRRAPNGQAADGGSADDELSFPLEDD